MPVIHITKTSVEGLGRPTEGRIDYFDDTLRGFGARVSAMRPGAQPSKDQEKTAGKTYFVMRRVNGKQVRVKIDTADKITAELARKRAEGMLADMGKGSDPNEGKRQARKDTEEKKQKAVTLQAALDDYVQKGNLKESTITNYKDLFKTYLSDWLTRPAANITRDMVLERHLGIANGKRRYQTLQKVTDPGAVKPGGKAKLKAVVDPEPKRKEAAADNCMRTLRAVLNYTFESDDGNSLYNNPVNVLSSRKHKAWFNVDRRQTLIRNTNLPAWYKAVMSLDNGIVRDYLLFLLFTGLRRKEAATLKWSRVDFQEGSFTIVDTKNGELHMLPLSSYLYQLLVDRQAGLEAELEEALAAQAAARVTTEALTVKQRQAIDSRVALAESRLASPYVFPGEGKTGHIVSPKRALAEIFAATGIKFSCHDLRRTFATIAESLDLSKYTLKDLLNHKRQDDDVTGGYIIMELERLRSPMQKITDAIQERVKRQHGKVIQMKAEAE